MMDGKQIKDKTLDVGKTSIIKNDIVNLDTLEFDTDNGRENSCVRIDDTHVINFWRGTSDDGFCQIFEVDLSDGSITAMGTPLEFDAVNGEKNNAVKINDTQIMNFWEGSGGDGFCRVFDVNVSTGVITALDSALEYDTTQGLWSSAALLDETHVINFWEGESVDGYCQIFEIDLTDGSITALSTPLEYDADRGGYPTAVALTENLVICAWTRNDKSNQVQAFSTNNTTGVITALDSAFQFGTTNSFSSGQKAMLVDVDKVMISWQDDGTAYLGIYEINLTTGVIALVGSTNQYGTNNNIQGPIIRVSPNRAVLAYSSGLKVVKFNLDGEIELSLGNTISLGAYDGLSVCLLDSGNIMVFYQGTSFDGFCRVLEVNPYSYDVLEEAKGKILENTIAELSPEIGKESQNLKINSKGGIEAGPDEIPFQQQKVKASVASTETFDFVVEEGAYYVVDVWQYISHTTYQVDRFLFTSGAGSNYNSLTAHSAGGGSGLDVTPAPAKTTATNLQIALTGLNATGKDIVATVRKFS